MAAERTLTLLSRAYCHLCDELRDALAQLVAGRDVRVVELDVDADAGLEAKFGELVPVLLLGDVHDGVELCHYTLDAPRVRTALADQHCVTPSPHAPSVQIGSSPATSRK